MSKLSGCVKFLREELKRSSELSVFSGFEEELCEGAVRGLDVDALCGPQQSQSWRHCLQKWLEWLKSAKVVLEQKDYLSAAIYALGVAPKLAATDYGTARQRDLGQLWTDAIRGFLGEIAFVKWLRERYHKRAELDYSVGPLDEYLPRDIKIIEGREPRLNVSIKTTKLNGIWLDVPGAQIMHSDVYVLVRVGVTREHFIAFLKAISVIRDKLFSKAVEHGVVDEKFLEQVWESLPEFRPVPAYVVGFLPIMRGVRTADFPDMLEELPQSIHCRIYDADCEVKVKRAEVNSFLGFWHPGLQECREQLVDILKRKGRNVEGKKIEFAGIRDFTRAWHFLANSGRLKRRDNEWSALLQLL
jgi:hypothetical protein